MVRMAAPPRLDDLKPKTRAGLPAPALAWALRPLGIVPTAILGLLILLGPAWLFADVLGHYRLFSDDFEYAAASRTFDRAMANLFVPHNAHVVPSWRVLTWALAERAGRLSALQGVFGWAAIAILLATMMLVGRLVARETGRASIGLAAMVATGTTAVLESAGTWYSAGQTLWAGFGILTTLWFLQGWRKRGGGWRLATAAVAAVVAGGFWTIGHAAGPVGAAYLLADGRKRCVRASLIPIAATLLAVAVAYLAGGRKLEGTHLISVHGRTMGQAIDPIQGAGHMFQAIPETLVLGNLGLSAETTLRQGLVLSAAIFLAWAWSLWRAKRLPNPLEAAGATLVLVAYWVEWSFRGYLPFSSLRGQIVPWYDAIPHLGAVLFAAGWWAGREGSSLPRALVPASRLGAVAVLALQFGLIVLHQPKVDAIFVASVPKMSEAEAKMFLVPTLQRLRAVALAEYCVNWQNRHLVKLDQAEAVARREGIGREAIARAFGRVDAPYLPKAYDAADMLDLPREGTTDDPARVRRLLGEFFQVEPEPTLPVSSFMPR